MRFLKRYKVIAWILVVALFLSLVSDFSYLSGAERVSANDFEDGVYTIEGKLRHATLDQPSMGDSAVTQPMKIVKSGNSISLRLKFKALTSGAFKGYLYGFYYFPSWTDSENMPKSVKAESAKVTEYYEGVYDKYNNPKTGLDSKVKGKLYPHYAFVPIEWNRTSTWVQIYVPVMEAVNKGGGTQYARLLLDWNTLTKTDEKVEDIMGTAQPDVTKKPVTTASPSAQPTSTKKPSTSSNKNSSIKDSSAKDKNRKLNIKNLSDGTYTIAGQMLKTDKKSSSMSNEAINHNISLRVKKGKYTLMLDFSGLTVGSAKGYLSRIRYFKSGYKVTKSGVPEGKTAAAKIISYQKKNGRKLTDAYGKDYPRKVSFPMIKEAKKNGYVPLQVFVPVMDAISKGSGTQPAYIKLDLNSIVAGKKSNSVTNKSSKSKKSSKRTTNSGASGKAGSESGSSSSAVSGKIYSCKIVPCYRHPVTNKVEDAGGNGSYATGQGMVESVLKTSGMLEQTDDGQSYLTMRVGLMDYTSDHKFYVQKRGAQSWQQVSPLVTKNGTDGNGKTADYCIPVSDKNCIVKLSMYVQSMGRNVIFYAYAKNFKAGKVSGMAVTHVSANVAASSDENSSKSGTYNSTLSETAGNLSENDNISISGNILSDTSSEISESGLSDAQGLSLSTEDESKENGSDPSGSQNAGASETAYDGNSIQTTGSNNGKSGNMTMAKWVVVLTISITLSGLVIIAAGAGMVYYFRRNWRRWGEEMEDDEE
ncbi:NEAT domain-containing protein [Eubacterium sp. MSJ-13]|uniref:heme-binding Shp domain-containing protein n=1 Tax=Eubacterium sp. MSJ-13 TaxID=2841513 RepID=UPI001C10B546|nr:heme-binding Shp domain-containing protein [Eubacterium sp. MSJ-13]MBU5477749.1 NEAT domain-containing protein [Eubacterium sp. MSJ-13]